jgi:hypothetical protein
VWQLILNGCHSASLAEFAPNERQSDYKTGYAGTNILSHFFSSLFMLLRLVALKRKGAGYHFSPKYQEKGP